MLVVYPLGGSRDEVFEGNGVIDFAQVSSDVNHKSSLNFSIRTKRPSIIFNAFLGKMINTNRIEGELSAKATSSFNFNNLNQLNFRLITEVAKFTVADKKINLVDDADDISILNGDLQKVNLKLLGDHLTCLIPRSKTSLSICYLQYLLTSLLIMRPSLLSPTSQLHSPLSKFNRIPFIDFFREHSCAFES